MHKKINLCRNNDFMLKWYISTWEFLKTYGINRIRLQHALVVVGALSYQQLTSMNYIHFFKFWKCIIIFLPKITKKCRCIAVSCTCQYDQKLSNQRVNPFYVVNCNQLSRNFFVLVIWEEFDTFEFFDG